MTFESVQPLRVAVVGAGTMGLDHVERLTRRTKGAVVSAVVEPQADRGRVAVEASGRTAILYPDIETMLGDAAADAVLIASPGAYHEAALHSVIEAGLPTLCEKPLTLTSESARRVVEHEMTLAAPLVQVGFHRRYDAGYRWLRGQIEHGDSGSILALHCRHRNPSLPPGWTDAMLIEDAAAHEMDIIAWLTDEPIVSIEVHRAKRNSLTPEGVHDPVLLLLRTSSGVLADVEINMNVQAAYQVSTEAVFEKGVAEVGRPEGPLMLKSGASYRAEHASYVTRFSAAYDVELQEWVDATRQGRRTGATAWDGYRAVLLCEAGQEAQRSDSRIHIPEAPRPSFYGEVQPLLL